jgi:5-methylthioadenosine/S-adenosylhomocysteine deaminase
MYAQTAVNGRTSRRRFLVTGVGTLTAAAGPFGAGVCFETDAITVAPVNNVYGAIVLGMDTNNVDTVIIAGTVKKRGGRLVG